MNKKSQYMCPYYKLQSTEIRNTPADVNFAPLEHALQQVPSHLVFTDLLH